MLFKKIPFLATIVLAGCASTYRVPSSTPTAELSTVTTALHGDSITRMYILRALASEGCEPNPFGDHVGGSMWPGTPSSISTDPVRIAATEQFHFVAGYFEHRFAENLECKVEAYFQPDSNKKYKGVFKIKGNVSSCDFALYDVTSGKEEAIQLEKPPFLCGYPGELVPRRNGQGSDVKEDIRVHLTSPPVK